jgi:hypothetical protein
VSFLSYKRDYLSIVKIRLSYMQIVSFYLLEFLKKLVNLSRRYPCGVQLDLSNGFPSPFVASSLYQGSCFAKHWVEVPFQHRLFLVAVPYLVSGFITSWCGSYQDPNPNSDKDSNFDRNSNPNSNSE